MHKGSASPHTKRLDWSSDQSNPFVELRKLDTENNISNKVIHILKKKGGSEYRDTSLEGLFDEWGPTSDLMEYTELPSQNTRNSLNNIGGSISRTQDSIPHHPVVPILDNSWLSHAQAKARDARLILLMTETGWIWHIHSIFIERLRIKESKGDYPPALYLSLREIITCIFDFYTKKYQLLEFSENITHQATFFQLMESTICNLITRHYIDNPEGWDIEKKVQSLGDALHGFITARKPITKGQVEKYKVYLGENSNVHLSAFELQILHTLKEIEQIIVSAEANYNPRLFRVFSFLKRNFLDLKYNRGELYKISIKLYYLSKSIQLAAQHEVILKNPPFWSEILKRIQQMLPKK